MITITFINVTTIFVFLNLICLNLISGIILSEESSLKLELFHERKTKEKGVQPFGPLSTPGLVAEFDFEEVNTTFSPESEDFRAILGRAGDRFTFKCSSDYLTRWTSNIVPKLPAQYIHSNRLNQLPILMKKNDENETSSFLNDIYVSELSLILPSGGSGHVQCENSALVNGTSQASVRVYLYSLDGLNLVNPNHWPILYLDTAKPYIVPCVANYPNVTAVLEANQEYIQSRYDPRIGFIVEGYEVDTKVTHTCMNGKQAIDFFVYNINSEEPDPEQWDLSPTLDNLLHFHIGGLNDEHPLGIFCSTQNFPVHDIFMINCNSKDECDWLRPCFHNNCTGNGINLKTAIPSYINGEENISLSSGTIREPYTRGMVTCHNFEGQQIQDTNYLLTGLDRQRYWLDKSSMIPLRAIIQINEIETILHTNQANQFVCETLNFLLISNIRFAVEFKNGTRHFVDDVATKYKSTGTVNLNSVESFKKPNRFLIKLLFIYLFPCHTDAESGKDKKVLVDEVLGFSRKEHVMNVTTEMVRIFCFAPWNNSSRWINTSRSFEARDVQPPQFVSQESKGNRPSVFYIGDATRSLFCNVSGEPKPRIHWTLPMALESKFKQLGINIEDESTLQFPSIDDRYRGNWNFRCTATNEYGSEFQDFPVDIQDPVSTLTSGVITAIVFAFIAFIGLALGLYVFIRKYINAKKLLRNLTPEEIEEFLKGNPERLKSEGHVSGNDKIQHMSFDPAYIIPESELFVVKSLLLGEGQFGHVYRGFLRTDAVAVKTTKSSADASYFKALLIELKTMCYIGSHPNVVHFYGAMIARLNERILYVVLELSPLGCLQKYLRKLMPNLLNLVTQDGDIDLGLVGEESQDKISTLHLIGWCKQIANAMNYLSSKQVLHGDLATRNVLVFNNSVVKITDFGLSKQLYGYEKYVRKRKVPLPWAWLAVESLRFQEFSTQSDVWSFGITVWEIFTMGQVPYCGRTWSPDFVNELDSGLRLFKPVASPRIIFEKLTECWNLEPKGRPSFQDLYTFFNDILEQHANALEVCESGTDLGWNPVVYSQL